MARVATVRFANAKVTTIQVAGHESHRMARLADSEAIRNELEIINVWAVFSSTTAFPSDDEPRNKGTLRNKGAFGNKGTPKNNPEATRSKPIRLESFGR